MILKNVVYFSDTNSVEATWVNSQGENVYCRSYAGEQMDDLIVDLGSDAVTYASLIAEVRSKVEPYVPPPPVVPATVTRFQALAVLAAGGYLDTVRTYINTLDVNNVQRLAWENAADWERTSPTLNALAAMLGLDDTQVDDLFIAASSISA